VLADALYGTQDFMDKAALITDKSQLISQLRTNQIVSSKNSTSLLSRYLGRQPGVKCKLVIRGEKTQAVRVTCWLSDRMPQSRKFAQYH